MARNKYAESNRENASKIAAKLSEVRGMSGDMAVKRRLRTAEERLSVSPPVLENDVGFIDGDVLRLLDGFMKVESEGVLTERYLSRIEELLQKRRTFK